jgi:GNAT superfamily N-acetyltransferase
MYQNNIREITAAETWPVRQRVMWPGKDIDFVKIDNDEEGIHYGLFENGTLISVISLFIKGEEARFRKFATEVAYQGKGYGSELLKYLMAEAGKKGVRYLTCDARLTAAGFYRKFGMEESSEVFTYSERGLEYIKMKIDLQKT